MSALTLVTGATGFIGAYVVRRLLAGGAVVRVLVRHPGLLPAEDAGRVQVVQGDLRSEGDVDRAVRGAHTVLHLAAYARAGARDPGVFRAVNVDAVRSILEAAGRYEVRRLVHVSTVLTLPPFRGAPVNGAAARPTPYEATKREAEAMVEACAEAGLPAVIVHPTRVYGPGPLTDANAVTRVVAGYLAGWFRFRLADGGVESNYVHADDVAAGILLAARHGRTGAHYALGGENVSFAAFLAMVERITGVHRHVAALPRPAALGIGAMGELWGRLGGTSPITRGWVRAFLEDRRVDIGPAREELGYAPRSLRAGLEETIAWLGARRGRGKAA